MYKHKETGLNRLLSCEGQKFLLGGGTFDQAKCAKSISQKMTHVNTM